MAIVGRAAGRHLHALAHNRDPRRVQGRSRRRSIGSQRALGRGHRSAAELDAILVGLVDRVTGRLRAAERACRTVVLRLRFDDFARVTRSQTLPEATTVTGVILAALRELLAAAAADPRARDHAAGHLAHEPRARRTPSSSRCRWTGAAPSRWTRPSTACASASASRRSRAPCCSTATRACRCRCCPTEPRLVRRLAAPRRAGRSARDALLGGLALEARLHGPGVDLAQTARLDVIDEAPDRVLVRG